MVSISEYLDKMVITVTSSDGNIRARVSDYTKVEITMRPGSLQKYTEERLGAELSRLGLTTWVAYHRGRSKAYQMSKDLSEEELAAAERPSEDPRMRRYEAELNAVEGVGVSPRRTVRIRTKGLMEWKVDVKPGAIAAGEQAFLTELNAAVAALIGDRQTKIIVLKSEHFDIGIPKKWRDIMAELKAVNARRR